MAIKQAGALFSHPLLYSIEIEEKLSTNLYSKAASSRKGSRAENLTTNNVSYLFNLPFKCQGL